MSLIKFLSEVGDIDVQLKIKREINGESADDDEDEGDDEEEIEEEEEKTVSKDGKDIRRKESPTLWAILRRYYTKEVPSSMTDWTCFIDFFKSTVHQLDMEYDIIDGYLRTLSQFIFCANRLLTISLKNNFSAVVTIGKSYYAKKYGLDSKKFTAVIEGHWRPILKVSKDVKGIQDKMKMEALAKRTKHQYKMDWDYYQSILKKYSQSLYVPDAEFTTTDAIKLLIVVQANTACRKTEVLDPIIEFHTWTAWRERLDETGVKQTNFIFGDDLEGLKTLGIDIVMNEFKEENILVQVGKLKDRNQRLVRFGDNVKETLKGTNIIIRKPTLMFSAKNTVLMVQKIRKHFGLTMGKRDEDLDARRKLGALIQSRAVREIMKKDFPLIIAHAKKHNFRTGTHFFRACSANFLTKVYSDKIETVTGSAVSDGDLMKTWLGHSGSIESVMSYCNVKVRLPMPKAALEIPDIHLVRIMQDRVDFLEQEMRELKELLKKQPVAVRQDDGMAEFTVGAKSLRLAKYKRNGNYLNDKQRDETMNHYAQILKDNGLPATHANMHKLGFGKDTVQAWAKKKPLGWTASNDKQSAPVEVEEKEVRILRNTATTVDLNQLPAGDKIIGFDPKDKKNTQNTQMKRNIEIFGEENVIPPSECEGSPKKMKFTTDKGTVIERTFCGNPRI